MKKTNTRLGAILMVGLLSCSGSAVMRATAQDADDEPGAPEAVLDLVAGGGWIVGTPSGAKANFSIVAGVGTNTMTTNSFLFGALSYRDHRTRMRVEGTNVTAYTNIDAQTREIHFDVTIDGAAGTATVVVSDQGEPGRNDTFAITLSNGYHASGKLGGGRHGGGNIQVNPGWDEDGLPRMVRPRS